MTERNRQVLALQRELSEEAQLRLQAEGQRQRLDLELQHVRRQQQKQQQVWLEGRRPKPEGEPRPASGASQQEEGISQVGGGLKLQQEKNMILACVCNFPNILDRRISSI